MDIGAISVGPDPPKDIYAVIDLQRSAGIDQQDLDHGAAVARTCIAAHIRINATDIIHRSAEFLINGFQVGLAANSRKGASIPGRKAQQNYIERIPLILKRSLHGGKS